MGAILLVVAVFAFLLYRNSVRQSNVQLDRMKTPLGQSTLTDESLTISNELGSVTMPWSSFKGMSEYDGFWLLHTSSSNAIRIPTAGIDSEVLGSIRQKIPARQTEPAGNVRKICAAPNILLAFLSIPKRSG